MEDLDEARQALEEVLTNGAKALKDSSNHLAWRAKSAAQRLKLPLKLIAVYILSATALDESALTFLQCYCRSPKSRTMEFDFTADDLQGWIRIAHADPDYQKAERNPDHKIAFRAYKHIGEYFTYKDVLDANANGVPVSSGEVVNKYKFHVPASGRGPKMLGHLSSLLKPKKREAWLRRFRRGWAVEYKKMKPRLHVALSRKQKQAALSAHFWFVLVSVFCAPWTQKCLRTLGGLFV